MNKYQRLLVDLILTILFIGALTILLDAQASEIDEQIYEITPVWCTIEITSGNRTKQKNEDVGGVKNSYHLKDRARDFIVKPKKGCRRVMIRNAKDKNNKLSVIIYRNHLHMDNRKHKVCLVKTKKWFKFCR